jgi:hypothetical protein
MYGILGFVGYRLGQRNHLFVKVEVEDTVVTVEK